MFTYFIEKILTIIIRTSEIMSTCIQAGSNKANNPTKQDKIHSISFLSTDNNLWNFRFSCWSANDLMRLRQGEQPPKHIMKKASRELKSSTTSVQRAGCVVSSLAH